MNKKHLTSAVAEKFIDQLRSNPKVEGLTLSWGAINSYGNLVECYLVSGAKDQTSFVIHHYGDSGFGLFNNNSSRNIEKNINSILSEIN